MNRIKSIGYTIALLGSMHSIFSQGVPLTGAPNAIIDTETWLEKNKLRAFHENDETLGDRFLFDEWKQGSLETTDGLRIKEIELKYDLLHDVLIGKLNGSIMSLMKKNIQSFTIVDDQIERMFRTVYYENEVLFLEVIYSGEKLMLYKRHTVILEKKDTGNQAYSSGVAFDKYVYKEGFFAEKGDNLYAIQTSKSAIVRFFSDKKDSIKNFIKEASINTKETEDLAQVFNYYESISN